ncbi:MAG: D-alanine--D-alanine ligase [Flavobacteriales bacterium]|nr:D-alanine--D-alanine ligase [Flavobacteriales bacterium]MCC6576308.1 D-alanine--D-alanine ligase [Flavobacteriales bacterium]NUQ15257.1 D-alanine--D-alanine ligase [Flavobacteriales bacterium]
MDPRPPIAVVRGGYSGESVISHQSAQRMLSAIDRARFDPFFVTITREDWTCERPDGTALPFDRAGFRLDRGNGLERFAVALIAIHGPPGEDGKLQGYLDMLGVPYQTGGVLPMALSFSKYGTTALLRQLGFRVSPSVLWHRDLVGDRPVLPEGIGYPCFVKPDESGSSLGVTKVKRPEDLPAALTTAFRECARVMVEAAVTGRELTCGVIRLNGRVKALPVCEIRTPREFFDYEAKYHATDTEELVPAPLSPAVTALVQQRSAAIYTALDLRGMVRVDHFWSGGEVADDNALVTIEVNTTPGFSQASIYPKMLDVDGLGVPAAVNGLLEDGLNRR